VSVPGASAVISALSISGLKYQSFSFSSLLQMLFRQVLLCPGTAMKNLTLPGIKYTGGFQVAIMNTPLMSKTIQATHLQHSRTEPRIILPWQPMINQEMRVGFQRR